MSITHVPFFPSDWLSGTRGLSATETGVYITLIARMYENAGHIERDDDRLFRLCGCKSKKEFRDALNYLVDEGKIIEADGNLFQEKVEKIIKEVIEKSSKAADAANARWKKKPNKNNKNNDADAMRPHDKRICQPKPKPNIDADDSAQAREKSSFDDLSNRLCIAAGIADETKSIGLLQISDPLNWLNSDCDLEADIIPTIEAVSKRMRGQPRSWAYFSEAVFEARDRRLRPSPAVQERGNSPPTGNRQMSDLEKIIQAARDRGYDQNGQADTVGGDYSRDVPALPSRKQNVA